MMLLQPAMQRGALSLQTFYLPQPGRLHCNSTARRPLGSWHSKQCNSSGASSHHHSSKSRTTARITTAAAPAASAASAATTGAAAAAVTGVAGDSISCSLPVKGPLTSWAAAYGFAAEPHAAFLFQGLDQLLPLLLGGWLAIMLIGAVAGRARQWCDAHPDRSEVIGLLPAVLEAPTRFAATTLLASRVLRTCAGLLQQYVARFDPAWSPPVDTVVRGITAALGPLDHLLLSLYTVLAVAVTTRVLTKWKTLVFELVLKHERGKEQVPMDIYDAELNSASSSRNMDRRSMQSAYSSSSSSAPGAGGSSELSSTSVGVTGVITREGAGGMMSVEMRRWSPTAAAESAAAMPDEASSDADAEEAGIQYAAGPVTGSFDAGADTDRQGVRVAGSRSGRSSSSSSSRRKDSGKWFVGKSADDVERLLLPLDGVLSWVLVAVAGLLTAHALGINIKPLLAVGGASSIIIGLATQTLLSNAVNGLSIFLSRPFVAGDSITVQMPAISVSGTVERITPLRTLMRTEDDVLVTVPNKTISDMIIYNRSRRDARRRFSVRNMKERQTMKFKVRQPHKELHQLVELQDALRQQLRRPGVAQQNVEVGLSKFSDVGAELLVEFLLLVAPGSPEGQRLLLDLSLTARQNGATLVSVM